MGEKKGIGLGVASQEHLESTFFSFDEERKKKKQREQNARWPRSSLLLSHAAA